MPLPQQDPQPRLIDERPRFYRLSTPRGVHVVVGLGGANDPASIQVVRPLEARLGLGRDRLKLDLSMDELWAIWALMCDAASCAGEPPEWATVPAVATGADGDPLPPMPTAVAAEPL
ncbi:hypothetical protein AB0J35_58000 [Nonomuraea angiospora]|uniref:hypothetical protein n=1 Tax=Nonomuraea angiospora TaxID=46172 RepID=UPI003421FCAD